ncbi:S-locus lectin protein kinase family protein [Hibiscus syriacus]|uniref:S-locus lectin protein kinase family protein n=1 Tax=Hibiscus syriacus TaxID=106335 RepID=A0A6A3BFR5_HIBSY|nr:S-locus lectin protein kinase family protein [Hibiscus syriacus]
MVQTSVVFLVFMLSLAICHADRNLNSALQCSGADNYTSESSFRVNLDNLLGLLTEKGASSNGFLKTAVGRKSGKIYGLMQCRGDVSAENCANCTRESVAVACVIAPRAKRFWFG